MHRYDVVILDSRPRTAYLYGHMQRSQPLTIDRIVQLDRYGSNLAPGAADVAKVFGGLGIDETQDCCDSWRLYGSVAGAHILDAPVFRACRDVSGAGELWPNAADGNGYHKKHSQN